MRRRTKLSKDIGKKQTQSKLTNFGKHNMEHTVSLEASEDLGHDGDAANASTEVTDSSEGRELGSRELTGAKEEILTAINGLKSDFSARLDGILLAVEETKRELSDCAERIAQAEVRVSTVEDEYVELREMVQTLKGKNKLLEDKVIDMETRSRLNNLRLVGLPEGAEGPDPCSFLEAWMPEALETAPLRHPIVIERAHRVGPRRDNEAPPRTLIMKFLNYKQKMAVIKAATAKKDVLYKNHQVRFYSDFATEVHKQRRQYNPVRQQLRSLGLRHGIIPPAKLVVTYREKTHTFNNPTEVQAFINKIKEETG